MKRYRITAILREIAASLVYTALKKHQPPHPLSLFSSYISMKMEKEHKLGVSA